MPSYMQAIEAIQYYSITMQKKLKTENKHFALTDFETLTKINDIKNYGSIV